jgi:hypothetical protein
MSQDEGEFRGIWQIIQTDWSAVYRGPLPAKFDPVMNAEATMHYIAKKYAPTVEEVFMSYIRYGDTLIIATSKVMDDNTVEKYSAGIARDLPGLKIVVIGAVAGAIVYPKYLEGQE